jgi:hypothetical protein
MFLERFLHDELTEHLLDHLEPFAANEVGQLAAIAKRLQERRLADWRARASAYFDLTDEELDELAEGATYDPHDPDRGETFECPECSNETAVVVGDEGDIAVCTDHDCREVHMLEHCDGCGALTLPTAYL